MNMVISSGLQALVRQKARALGAISFKAKPINTAKLMHRLSEYGIYPSQTRLALTPQNSPLKDRADLLERLEKIANIAMVQAAKLLTQLLHVRVRQPIANITLIERSQLNSMMSAVERKPHYALVGQGFAGSGVSGEALLFFTETNSEHMAKLLHYEDTGCSEPEIEVLLEMSNMLCSAFIKGLGEQLEINFGLGQPNLLGHQQLLSDVLPPLELQAAPLLCIEIPYELEQQHIKCKLRVLLTPDSTQRLEQRLTSLLQ